jgi:hypothetical protein
VQTLAAEAGKATHKYAGAGSYPVKVQLKDTDGEGTATITNATTTVQVVTAIGSYKFNVASNWTWKGGGATAKLLLSGIPAGATRVWVDWVTARPACSAPPPARRRITTWSARTPRGSPWRTPRAGRRR